MRNKKLEILKKIKEAKLRQVVLIENFIHYCEGNQDFLKTKEGKQHLNLLIEGLEGKK